MKTALLCVAALAGASPAAAQGTAATPHRIALVGGQVLDPVGRRFLADQTILIEDSVITAIFPAGTRLLPPDAQMIDIRGRYVIPGLIDTHVHLATDPDGEDSRARTTARLYAALYGGVTSVRDMAGDARVLAGLARDARVGGIASPDIYYAALFSGPAFFADPRTHSSARGAVAGAVPFMRAVTDTTDLTLAVAQAKGTGATAIKLYAALDSGLVARIVTEAHRQGLLVWAHAALNPAMPAQVVGAGVDAVSHATLLLRAMTRDELAAVRRDAEAGKPIVLQSEVLDAVLRRMAAHGVMFDPTLFIFGDTPAFQRLAAALTRRAFEAGVLISTGTDSLGAADSLAPPNIYQEMELLVSAVGIPPEAALLAATTHGARTIGIADRVGTLEAGKQADLVVLRADPLADITNVAQVEFVVKRGRLFRRQ